MLQGKLPAGWQWVASSKEAVVAVTSAEPRIFYKEFLARSPFEKIKSLVRGSRCQRARRHADLLREAGLASPAVLGWGRGRKNEFFLTAAFSGVGFFDFLQDHFSGPLSGERLLRKRRLVQEAGILIGRLHCQGISHGDLRQNNLLVREQEKGFTFCFVDNERNRSWRQVPLKEIITNLVQFSICSGHLLTRSDLLRLFNAYQQAYPRFHGKARQQLLGEVISRSRQRVLYYNLKERLDRAARLEGEQGTGRYHRQSILGGQLESGCDLKQWFGQGSFCKDDTHIQVKRLSCPAGVVVAKKFLGRGIFSHLKVWLRRERPPRLWQMSHLFMALEIPIARPLGYLLAGRGPWRRQSYFFSAYAAGKQDLHSLATERPDIFATVDEQGLFFRIAFYLARLHNNGYCHGDTKWANIMVEEKGADLLFIDLDGAGPVKSSLGRGIVKDVSRFVVDMVEHEVPAAMIQQFIKEYSNMRVLDRQLVQKKITPHIKKALVRHGRRDHDVQGLWSV